MRRYLLGVALIIGCLAVGARPGAAEGALAIALPDDVVKGGFAYGSAYRFDTSGEAQAKALERCRETKSDERRKLCRIIKIFHDQCVAVAMDPADGTPGVGWAIGEDLLGAEREALEKCEATAGPGRRAACKVHNSGCDGKGK
ncbi:MAG TPA: DUF4189 domain-containing protein [Pseudolabrys sp.]|jgi:hypothetical protein